MMKTNIAQIRNRLFNINLLCDHDVLYCDLVRQLSDTTCESSEISLELVVREGDVFALQDKYRNCKDLILYNEIKIFTIPVKCYYYAQKQHYIIIYKNFAVVEFTLNNIVIEYDEQFLSQNYHNIYTPYLLCTAILYEIASISGLLVVHASCVQYNEKGILFIAPKGNGKSTLSLGLSLEKGYFHISDDKVLYSVEKKCVYSLPDVIRLNEDIYHRLALDAKESLHTFAEKNVFNYNNFSIERAGCTKPTLLFFPQIVYDKACYWHAEKIKYGKALEKMLEHRIVAFEPPNNTLIATSIDLLRQSDSFLVTMGYDVNCNINNLHSFIEEYKK